MVKKTHFYYVFYGSDWKSQFYDYVDKWLIYV